MSSQPEGLIHTLEDRGQLIGGRWQTQSGSELISECPVNEATVWRGQAAGEEQIDEAFKAARQAVRGWGQLSAEKRVHYVEAFAKLVGSQSEELAQLISAETGKPLWESKTEAAACVGKIAVSVDAFRQRRDMSSFEMGELQAVTRFKPFGVMGVLGL